MEDITDFAFRQVLLKIGSPDVFFTEFVNVDGLASQGKKHVVHRLEKSEGEKPIILQLWGNDPQKFLKSIDFVKGMGFDGININMGCPVKKVLKVGCGSALILEPELAERIVKEIQDRYPDIPLGVKTRLGFEKEDIDNWIGLLLKLNLKELIVHGRTAKQVFKGSADWEGIRRVVQMNDTDTRIVGNGDVISLKQGEEFIQKYGVDGIMIGREVFKNPWVFNKEKREERKEEKEKEERKKEERIETLLFHMDIMHSFTQKFPDKGWQSIKKFYHGYLREDEFLTDIRKELFLKTDLVESIDFLKERLESLKN